MRKKILLLRNNRIIAAAIIGGLISACAAFGAVYWDIHVKEQADEKSVAQVLLIDILKNEDFLKTYHDTYKEENNNISRFSGPVVPLKPIMDNNRIYFAFSKDIAKFDLNTSAMLYDYYFNLIEAENDQIYLNSNNYDVITYDEIHPERDRKDWLAGLLYDDMKTRIIQDYDNIPKIKMALYRYIEN